MPTRFFENEDFKLVKKKYRRWLPVALALLALLVGAAFYFLRPADGAKTAAEKDFIAQQSAIFAGWYEAHQSRLATLGHQWRTFNHIQRDFEQNLISIEETYVRLIELRDEALKSVVAIKDGAPPLELDDEIYDLASSIYHKSLEYAKAQYNAIGEVGELANAERFNGNLQNMQSRKIKELALRRDPITLFIAKDLARAREILHQ